MTSSLVGSEMCIRDRVSDEAVNLAFVGVSNVKVESVPTGMSEVLIAVSYTHLTLPTICSV
eukprot:2529397-Prorocentrum_lima.AAC.1